MPTKYSSSETFEVKRFSRYAVALMTAYRQYNCTNRSYWQEEGKDGKRAMAGRGQRGNKKQNENITGVAMVQDIDMARRKL